MQSQIFQSIEMTSDKHDFEPAQIEVLFGLCECKSWLTSLLLEENAKIRDKPSSNWRIVEKKRNDKFFIVPEQA